MVKRNWTFSEIQPSYLFVEIDKRRTAFEKANPNASIISLGIGDTTEPLPPAVVQGLEDKAKGLSRVESYTGYGKFNGDADLRKAISKVLYDSRVAPDEIFVSDGSKPDFARMQYLWSPDTTVAIQNPTYPVYVDATVISGKAGRYDPSKSSYPNVVLLECTPENEFFPDLDKAPRTDLIYFCSGEDCPGSVASRAQLKRLVDFARKNQSIIVYDAAYAEYVRDTETYPKTIFEIEGAREVAIETNSFSKTLGYTGVRLGWTVCPEELKFDDGHPVIKDWSRIMGTFFNGPSNISEAGALASLLRASKGNESCIKEMTDFYLGNAAVIRRELAKAGFEFYGGANSPYIWLKVPEGLSSWETWQELLEKAHVVTTPGEGFGSEGRKFIRISAFAHREHVEEAMRRIVENFGKK